VPADTTQLVDYVIRALVDSPDDVKIEEKRSEGHVVYEVSVHPDDVGKVIGRQGRIVKAIRTLVRAAGSIDDTQVDVDILG
jgi:uncharacterized protein